MKFRSLAVAGVAATALATAPAANAQLDQTVTGIAADSIALSVPVAAVFGTTFSPGATVNSTLGAITAVSTNPNWTLSAAETGGDGKMARSIADGVCATSTPTLTNAAGITVTPVVPNASITSTARTLSGSNQVVAAASAVPLAATVFSTTYSQVLPASEILATGCTYTMTTTYTLAAGA
jgi:hypothetical protein